MACGLNVRQSWTFEPRLERTASMGNRIFVAVVVLLWTSTMSWLMVARILPPFFQGEPPRTRATNRRIPELLADRDAAASGSAMRSARRCPVRSAPWKSTVESSRRDRTPQALAISSWQFDPRLEHDSPRYALAIDYRFARIAHVVRYESSIDRCAARSQGPRRRRWSRFKDHTAIR